LKNCFDIEARSTAFSVVSTLEIRLAHFLTYAVEMIGAIPHINLASLLLRYKNVNFSNLIVLKLKLEIISLLFEI